MGEIKQMLDSRRVFVKTLNELAKTDDKIIVLVSDVGFNYLDDPGLNFKVTNTGVTEQSTVMIAVGLALSGFKPYVYSMINFVLFRPYEMVRNGIVKHNANVKLIGVKGSEKYRFLGFSHNLLHENEDIKVCENVGLNFVAPSLEDVKECIKTVHSDPNAWYIRL